MLSHRVPLKICMKPTIMIRVRAKSFPAVNMSWMRVAHRTLELFTQVRRTGEQKTEFSEMKLCLFKNTQANIEKHRLIHAFLPGARVRRSVAFPEEIPAAGASLAASSLPTQALPLGAPPALVTEPE